MAEREKVTIRIDVDADTAAIDRLQKRLNELCRQADRCHDTFTKLGKSLDDNEKSLDKNGKTTDKTSKRLKDLGKVTEGVAKVFRKTFSLALKGTALETAALAAALSSVNLLLKTGQILTRAWNASVRGLGVAAANAAAGVAALAAVFTQAMRQFAAAQSSANYKGSFAGASQGLRTMQTDVELAVFGVQSLTSAFAAASRNSPVNAGTVKSLRGLADFAIASGDMEKGLTAAANLVSLLQSGKASGGQDVLKAAAELGPQFEKAYKEALKGGKATNAELLKMFSSGALAEQAGVAGTAGNVRGTLMGQLKTFATEFQVMFADIGQNFIEPVQRAFNEIRRIFYRTVVAISGNLGQFARGPFVDTLVKVVDKLGELTATLFNEYLPKTGEVVNNFVNKWNSFTGAIDRGFTKFGRFLNKFSDASREINKFFGGILKTIGGELRGNFGNFSELIMENRDNFQEFGEELGKLIKEIFRLFRTIREAFFRALPAINGLVGAVTRLVGAFASLVGILSGLPGLGGVGGFALGGLGLMGLSKKGRGRLGVLGRNAVPIGALAGSALLGQVPGIGGALMAGGLGAYGGKMAFGGMTKAGNAIMNSRFGGAGTSLGYRAAGMANMSAMRFAGAGAVAGLGAYGTNMAMNFVENQFGNTAATVGTGAVGGALTGAAVGSIVPVIGTAAGAVIGAAIGAIAGFLKSDEAKKKARKAGEGFAEGYADNITLALQHGAIREAETMSIRFDTNLQKATDGMNRAGEARKKADEVFGKRMEDIQPVIDQFNRNLDDLTRITGKTEEEIIALAQSAEVDLGSNLLDLQEIMHKTGLAVGKFGDDFNAAINNVIGEAATSIYRTFEILDAPRVMDQAAIALQEAIASGAGLTDQDRSQFLQTLFTQAQLVTGGDPLETIRYLRENIGTLEAPGIQFTTPGSRLYGLQGELLGGGGAQMMGAAYGTIATGLRDVIRGNIISEVGRAGATIDVAQLDAALAGITDLAELERIGEAVRQSGFITNTTLNLGRGRTASMEGTAGKDLEEILGTDAGLRRSENQEFLAEYGNETEKLIAGFGTALDPLEQGIATFNENIDRLIEAVGGDSNSTSSSTTSTSSSDSSTRRRARNQDGDTASPRWNMLQTLGKHSSFDMGIAGTRRVTSGLRNYNLGSLSSDHAMGRAYDLTGQNLGAYQSAVRAAGGLAEFHGAGGSRHLHVVPGAGPVGDSATPYMGAPSGGGSITTNDSYSIVVNAAPGMDVKQLADEVMSRLERKQRDMYERRQ